MEKRFLTKQEADQKNIKTYRGFPFGEPTHSSVEWEIFAKGCEPELITTAPHPYDRLKVQVKTTDTAMSKAIQKKAFRMGFSWKSGDKKVKCIDLVFFNFDFHHLVISHGNCTFDFQLTPQQFLEGYLPQKIHEIVPGSDAYIKNSVVYVDTGGSEAFEYKTIIMAQDELHRFNLMSQEEYEKKHKKRLKFGEWEVSDKGDTILVGCRSFSKKDIGGLMRIAHGLAGMNDSVPSIGEIYNFVHAHKEELGLEF